MTAHARSVRVVENCWIPLADGCRLAARMWLPTDAEQRPVPAVLEYIPYRKRDGTRRRDEPMHSWFASHGYAAIRIDLRGTGDSDGVLLDEYLEREQLDGLEALRWIAAQPWCTGAVGLMGKSWGGFNALQIAARRPPELRAVITVCSTDDRYADDAHYMGGCLLNENLVWGSILLTLNARPPDPEIVGARWREMWRERLEATPLFPATWLSHQRRDDYWRHGSVCEDFASIECPVFAVGGWADGYSNAVPRLLSGLRSPRRGLVGPWAHVYPHDGVPGPAIGFLQEAVRWWDAWLKDERAAHVDEPFYRVWMQTASPPGSPAGARAGRWIAEEAWPSPRIVPRTFALHADGVLAREDSPSTTEPSDWRTVHSPLDTGEAAGAWCGFGIAGEGPGDQREDDRRSLVFDSEPLEQDLEILGAPVFTATLSCDRPLAMLAVRLNEVFPDGTSARVSFGLLNLSHAGGHERAVPLVPGRPFDVRLKLNDVAHAFAAGRRLRLALSTSYWPMAWPSPEAATVSVRTGASRLELPVRPPAAADARLRAFEPPASAAPAPCTQLTPVVDRRTARRDSATGELVHTVFRDTDAAGGPALHRLDEIDLVRGHASRETYRIHPDDPLSARAEIENEVVLQRPDWSVGVDTKIRMSSTATEFVLDAELVARHDDATIFERTWEHRIARDGA